MSDFPRFGARPDSEGKGREESSDLRTWLQDVTKFDDEEEYLRSNELAMRAKPVARPLRSSGYIGSWQLEQLDEIEQLRSDGELSAGVDDTLPQSYSASLKPEAETATLQQLDDAVEKSTQAILDWVAEKLTVRLADTLAPGAGMVVEASFKVWELIESAHALVSDQPILIVPVAQIAPGVHLQVSTPLSPGTETVTGFIAPDLASFTGAWSLESAEVPEEPKEQDEPEDLEVLATARDWKVRVIRQPDDDEQLHGARSPVSYVAEVDISELRLGRKGKRRAEVLYRLITMYLPDLRRNIDLAGVDLLVITMPDRTIGMWVWLDPLFAPSWSADLTVF